MKAITTLALLVVMTAPALSGTIVLDTSQTSREVYHETGQLMYRSGISDVDAILDLDFDAARLRWSEAATRRMSWVEKVYDHTETTTPEGPFDPIHTVRTWINVVLHVPEVDFTSDWGDISRGPKYNGHLLIDFDDWSAESVDVDARLVVLQKIDNERQQIIHEEATPATFHPTGDTFSMEGSWERGRSTRWTFWGDGPSFVADDPAQFTIELDGQTHTFGVDDFRFSIDSMVWVPEPSTVVLSLFALVGWVSTWQRVGSKMWWSRVRRRDWSSSTRDAAADHVD